MAKQKQTISVLGINTHHQNGLAEEAIHDPQEQARTNLLHAQARWSQVIHTSRWPYTMRTACYISNILPPQCSTQS